MAVTDYPDWTDLVNIVGTDIMVAIDLQGAYIMMPVDLQAQYITLDINIKASAVTLSVNITSQTANLNVNLAASAVTLDINIKASAVTLNIATSSTTNIVIDKLVQEAFTARIFTLSNDNGVTTPTAPPLYQTNKTYYGKFFPRGCRGMLASLAIYCKHTGAGVLNLSYAPAPGMGAIGAVSISPGSSWEWQGAVIEKMWNYDSLFVWVSYSAADVSWGYQAATPYDEFLSADSGVTWAIVYDRMFIRAYVGGATIGDIPVSGTLNTIDLPAQSSQNSSGAQTINPGVTLTLLSVDGSGCCDFIIFYVAAAAGSDDIQMLLYCDDVLTLAMSPFVANFYGIGTSTPGVTLTKYAVDGICSFVITKRFEFRRSFLVRAQNSEAAAQAAQAIGVVNLKR
jgi:hypothetical protein